MNPPFVLIAFDQCPALDATQHEVMLRKAGAHTVNALAEIVDPG